MLRGALTGNRAERIGFRDAQRVAAGGSITAEDEALLTELDAARDPSITVCAPSEFGYIEDDTFRNCPCFAECSSRAIRMAAEGDDNPPTS